MGYRQNQGPFLHLAQRALYDALREAALGLHGAKERERAAAIESWLLGPFRAGAQGPEGHLHCRGAPVFDLPWWAQSGTASGSGRPITPDAVSPGRPSCWPDSWSQGCLVVCEPWRLWRTPKEVTRVLSVASDTGQGPAYIGEDRARDLAVNVALPLFHSIASTQGQPDEAEGYLKLYRQFGKLQGNDLTQGNDGTAFTCRLGRRGRFCEAPARPGLPASPAYRRILTSLVAEGSGFPLRW